MTGVAWPTLIDALVKVEGLAPDQTGLLSFGTPSRGGIFVEKGRICWAAADGLQRRLDHLLRTHVGLHAVDLDAMYQRCRAEGRLLGQTLVEEGWLLPRDLEVVLRRHSAESVVALCRSPQPTSWSARGGRGYAPRFTFRPLDMLLDAVALCAPELHERARAELAPLDAPGRRGAAFVVDAALDAPLPIAVFGDGVSIDDLRTTGQWAAALPLACRELAIAPSFTLSADAAGAAVSVWWRGPLLYAVTCDDRAGIAALTAHHLACS